MHLRTVMAGKANASRDDNQRPRSDVAKVDSICNQKRAPSKTSFHCIYCYVHSNNLQPDARFLGFFRVC